jgi:hypothetical protein
MKTFTQNEPLTDAELDRLGGFLKGCKGGRAMNVEEFEQSSGYLWSSFL